MRTFFFYVPMTGSLYPLSRTKLVAFRVVGKTKAETLRTDDRK